MSIPLLAQTAPSVMVFTEKEECFPEKTTDLSTESTTAFGRTLITRAKENCYLKVQSKNETDREFRRGSVRL